MDKILVAYATNSGSTKEVADYIASKAPDGVSVDVMDLTKLSSIDGYQGVIIAAPMILGIHSAARSFLRKHQAILSKLPHACIFTAMNVTKTDTSIGEVFPVSVDPNVAQEPVHPGRLSFKENYALPTSYLKPVENILVRTRPISVAFLGGKLEMFRLPLLQALFVMLIIQAKPGDLRNWEYIEEWSQAVMGQFITK